MKEEEKRRNSIDIGHLSSEGPGKKSKSKKRRKEIKERSSSSEVDHYQNERNSSADSE